MAAVLGLFTTGVVASTAPTLSHAVEEGTNVALASNGATASASGTEVDDGRWPVAAINDGDASTRWSSNTADDAWASWMPTPGSSHQVTASPSLSCCPSASAPPPASRFPSSQTAPRT